jgi:hypothetical protein
MGFRNVLYAEHAPGTCFVCNKGISKDTPGIDLEKEIENSAFITEHFYICEECIGELGFAVGHPRVGDYQKLEAKHFDLSSKCKELQDELDLTKQQLEIATSEAFKGIISTNFLFSPENAVPYKKANLTFQELEEDDDSEVFTGNDIPSPEPLELSEKAARFVNREQEISHNEHVEALEGLIDELSKEVNTEHMKAIEPILEEGKIEVETTKVNPKQKNPPPKPPVNRAPKKSTAQKIKEKQEAEKEQK